MRKIEVVTGGSVGSALWADTLLGISVEKHQLALGAVSPRRLTGTRNVVGNDVIEPRGDMSLADTAAGVGVAVEVERLALDAIAPTVLPWTGDIVLEDEIPTRRGVGATLGAETFRGKAVV